MAEESAVHGTDRNDFNCIEQSYSKYMKSASENSRQDLNNFYSAKRAKV